MLRKLFWGGAGAVLVGTLVFGSELWSYIGTGMSRAHRTVKESVPLEFELDRARNMLNQIEPEIKASMTAIAREESEVERLEKQVGQQETSLKKKESEMQQLGSDLASGRKDFVYAGRNYSAEEVKNDVKVRLANCTTRRSTIEHLNQVMKARKAGLVAAQQKLNEMRAAKQQLALDIENLEAKRKMVEVAQIAGEFNLDDSRIAKTRELLADLNARVDVMAKLTDAQTTPTEIQLDGPAADDVVDSVAKYFGEKKPTTIEVANKEVK